MGINWSLDYIAGEQYSFQFLKKDTFEMHVHLKGPKKKKKDLLIALLVNTLNKEGLGVIIIMRVC